MTSSISLSQSQFPADRSSEVLESTVGALLRQRAAEYPDRLALIAVGHEGSSVRLTYTQLLDEAEKVATALATAAPPGAHVALWAPNVAEWPVIQYGAALAGVVLVALNPVLTRDELEYALQHSQATVLIHAPRSRSYDMASVVHALEDRNPQVRMINLTDRAAWSVEVDRSVLAKREPSDPNQPVMLQYTSGTTGRPKGVLLRHCSIVNVGRFLMSQLTVEEGATVVNPLPMFHSGSCVSGTLGTLWLAGTQIVVEKFTPDGVLDIMRTEKATAMIYVPTMLNALVHAQQCSSLPAPKVRTLLGGAANVAPALVKSAEETFETSVMIVYGQTELGPVLTTTLRADDRQDVLSTIGRPLPQVDVKIVSAETGEVVALGEVGEICARGYQTMIEYYRDAAATRATIDSDGYVRTGDLGRMDRRGYISITGRLKELIIRGGENIAPAEIEGCLISHSAVLDVAVVGLPDDYWGEVVAAVVRLKADVGSVPRSEIESLARDQLAVHKVPSRWFTIDEFPQTASGKVRKFELVEALVSGTVEEFL